MDEEILHLIGKKLRTEFGAVDNLPYPMQRALAALAAEPHGHDASEPVRRGSRNRALQAQVANDNVADPATEEAVNEAAPPR